MDLGNTFPHELVFGVELGPSTISYMVSKSSPSIFGPLCHIFHAPVGSWGEGGVRVG